MNFLMGTVLICIYIGNVFVQTEKPPPYGKNLWETYYGKNKFLRKERDWGVTCLGRNEIWPAKSLGPGEMYCFVRADGISVKEQSIDLEEIGFPTNDLDHMELEISVQEWYSCPSILNVLQNISKTYVFEILLINGRGIVLSEFKIERSWNKYMGNRWARIKKVFRRESKGIRNILFLRNGEAFQFGSYISIRKYKK